jgi:RNA polymerase sigma factor (sigma-70 family)
MTPLLSSALLRAQTDDRLVELAAGGHDRAFEAIVERYRRPLLRYLRRLLSDTLAEDVVQATFINAWSSLRTGTEVRDLRPWLYRIAHNAAINSLKKVGEAMEEVPESAGGFATGPAAEVERRDEMQRALTSIAALPSRQRTALLAVAVDGRAHSEVAAELGLTDGAVRQLVHRARTTLRTGLTAVTPMPLLHVLMTSAGDSTVARVAEVAAGAGGAGAASLSLKAGAAAVLATGALVTGGPQVTHVVHPSQRPAAPAARASAAAAPATPSPAPSVAASPAAATIAQQTQPASTPSSSGRSHKQHRRGQTAHKTAARAPTRHRGSDGTPRASRSATGHAETTSGRHQGTLSSGHDDATDTHHGGDGDHQQHAAPGKHDAATGDSETASRKATGGGDGAKKAGAGDGQDLVVKSPTATPADDGGDARDGAHAGADAPPTATTPPPTVAPVPTTPTTPTETSAAGTVRTEPADGSGGAG